MNTSIKSDMKSVTRCANTLDIDRLVDPRPIAIIGASNDPKSISGQPMRFLIQHGYQGVLYPVNPKYAEIDGVACHASIAALPSPDLAYPRRGASRSRTCCVNAAKKVSASRSSTAPDSRRRAKPGRVAARMRGHCEGVRHPRNRPELPGFRQHGRGRLRRIRRAVRRRLWRGGLSLISQSGGFGCALLLMADELGIGLRHFITTGNEADVSLLDLVDACIADPQTSLIAAYIEGLKDARRSSSRQLRARRRQAVARMEGRQYRRRREGSRVGHSESGWRIRALSHGFPPDRRDRSHRCPRTSATTQRRSKPNACRTATGSLSSRSQAAPAF